MPCDPKRRLPIQDVCPCAPTALLVNATIVFPSKGTRNAHNQKDKPSVLQKGGLLSCMEGDIGVVVELDKDSPMFENGNVGDLDKSDIILPAGVHLLLNRNEMLQSEEALQAVRKEAAGLAAKGTWDEDTVREASAVRDEARRSGIPVHFGSLMSICSIKFAELAKHLQLYKGRLVYRGDCAKDEWGAAALYQELNASPTSIATTNSTIAYGTLPGNKISTADAVKALSLIHI